MNDQPTILAVDDTTESRELLVRLLSEAGYCVRPADSGERALAAVSASLPNLILLEVRMKGLDGLEVCRRLKAREDTRQVPVILISAFAEVAEWVEGLRLGAADYIAKPLRPEELLLRVETHLALRRASLSLEQQGAALRESENRFRLLFTAVPDALFVLDCAGRFVDCNEAAEQHYGYSRAELLHMTAQDLATPELREQVGDRVKRALETGATFEWRHCCKDGTELPVEISAKPMVMGGQTFLLSSVRDLTEHKRAEEAQRESERRLELVLEGSQLGYWDWDIQTGKVHRNAGWAEMLGYTLQEIEFNVKQWSDLQHPDDREVAWRSLSDHLEGRTPAHRAEYRMRAKDGQYKWILDQARVVERDARGRPLRMSGTHTDITERKQAEQKLHQSEQRFAATFYASPVPLAFARIADGRFIDVNDAFLRLLEYQCDEVVGRTSIELGIIAPKNRAQFTQRLRESGGLLSGEFQVQTKSGRQRIVVFSTTVMQFDCEVCHLSAMIDVTERRQAEEALRNSEEFIKAALDNLPVGVAVNSIEPNVAFEYMNDNFPRFYRTTREKLADPDAFWDVVYEEPAFRKEIKKRVLDDVASGNPERMIWSDVPITRRGEETHFVTARNVPVAGKPLMISVVWDVTERKRLELDRQRFYLLAESSSEFIGMCDLALQPLYVNPAGRRLVGLPDLAAACRVKVPDYFFPEDQKFIAEEFFPRVLREGHGDVEIRLRHFQTGEAIWLFYYLFSVRDATGTAVGWATVSHDITERRRAEAERERLMMAIGQAAEAIVVTDTQGTIQYVNPAFERITGYACQEAIGQNPRILKSGEHEDAFYRGMWETLTRGESWSGRFVNKRKDGTLYTSESVISPVRGAAGKTVNYVAVKRDITGELVLEAQLHQAQKMESVGRLAGGVAHDFNNMLGVILGHTELLLAEIDSAHPFHADLTEIQKAAQRSADLTRQLLAFARRQTVAPKILDLNETIASMLKMLQRLIGEDIEMAWIPGEKVWPVKIDPGQIDQILANLCVNARDAIDGVGKVTIETVNTALDEAYCANHHGAAPGEYVTLTVSDNGCGMDAEILGHLFEPFFTTKEMGKGTGLGLATVYGAVKQNNGHINVYSELGLGTTFKIHLPRHLAKPDGLPDKGPEKTAQRGHETILLVEDEPAILRMTTMMLQREGYTVVSAGTPGQAIRLAKEHVGQIHLLMSDVVMPEMNGRDLAKNILSIYPDVKCLFMSGYTANVIAHHGVLDEGVNFIQKPFSRNDLTVKVREVLDRH